jgi:dTDP-4-dehydrorhamnose reductase
MENILITGAAGLLGSNLSYILRSSANIIAIDKNEISIKDVTSICGSALDLHLVNSLMIKYKISVILHCVALVNMDMCEEDAYYANIVNNLMAGNLSFLADKFNAQMIYISTDAVYPGKGRILYKETDDTNPISIYGKTKLLGEKYVMLYKKNLIIRTNIYGFNYRDKDSFGEWIIDSLRNNQELSMFDDLYFSPILVNRLCELLFMCIDRKLSGLYNICCSGSISKYEFACEIKRQFKLSGSISKASMKNHKYFAPRTQNMGMDNSKIKKALNVDIPSVEVDVAYLKDLYDQGYPRKLKGGI